MKKRMVRGLTEKMAVELAGKAIRDQLRLHLRDALQHRMGIGITGEALQPTRFVDIGAVLETKPAPLRCHSARMRPFPHARSLEGIRDPAVLRGSSVRMEAAEAFVVMGDPVS